jgi:small subunit ribosomal protein S4
MTKIVKSKMKSMRRWDNQIWTNIDYSNKKYPPGQHGKNGYRFSSGYCSDLRVKQCVKKSYLASETLMKTACRSFKKNKKVNFADAFTAFFELMALKVVFSCSFASSIFSARQLLSHSHFLLNGKKINIARMRLKVGDVLSVRDASKNHQDIKNSVAKISNNKTNLPPYLEVDSEKMTIKVLRLPTAEEISLGFEPKFTVLASFY